MACSDSYRRELESYAGIGYAISVDSCRPDDVGSAVLCELEAMGLEAHPTVAALRKALEPCYEDGGRATVLELTDDDDDELAVALEEAEGLLEESLPEGWYYGSLEGDGACFGIWPTESED